MTVNTKHKLYNQNFESWELVRDCVAGSKAVKDKGVKYLPKPNAEDESPENSQRYKDYLKRANFVNFTGNTLKGMLGMAFREDLVEELAPQLEYLSQNFNGAGVTLDQAARKILAEVIKCGRYGLLADYPEVALDESLTIAEVDRRNLRAIVALYPAESCINWRTTIVDGVKKLSLVVLSEIVEKVSTDGFEVTEAEYFRVLRLVEGVYTIEIYDDEGQIISASVPRKSDGSTWDEIPFIFPGAQNNDETPDKSPLYDIAEINISHYQNSADFEESSFIVGQPTPVLSGLTQMWVEEVLKGKIALGSRGGIPLPEGGGAALLQAAPNQMPERGMELKEQSMVRIGARIITDAATNETAEAAKIRFAGQNSELGLLVGNVESAINQCLEWCSWFMGSLSESFVTFNREFYDSSMQPAEISAAMMLLDRGVIAKTDVRSQLRESGYIEEGRTDQEIDDEVANDGVL